jgi:hypothetical protein
LTDRQPQQVHALKVTSGTTYVIEMRSMQLDSYLKLRDADGALADENDDIAPDNRDARLIFTATEDALYSIVATSFQQKGRGGYTLTIRAVAGAAK